LDCWCLTNSFFEERLIVGENTNVTGTNVIAGTNIKFSDPLNVGNGTDVTSNNIINQVAMGAGFTID
jgi:hypothetical protein